MTAATRDQWRDLVRATGVPEEALTTTTYDGLTLAPLYDLADLPETIGVPPAAPGGRKVGAAWEVRPRHETADPEAVLADVENGADSLWLTLPPDALPHALRDVRLDLVSVVLDAGDRTEEAMDVLLALAADRGVPAASLRGCLGAVGRLDDLPALARRCRDELPGMRAIVVDATPYHEAGGSDAEELGCSIATGLAHLRELTAHGLGVAEAFGQIEFRYAATADQFATIAKLRAARILWSRVAEVCAGPPGQVQHAVTSAAMMTRRDPYTNLLRTTLACFAAGIGGADAVTVRPFDDALGPPGDFSRRIARNTSALLIEEAHVARVSDPAHGSWYVERRTADLADKAWHWFQEIEEAGGMVLALASNLVSGRIAATGATRSRDIARRRAAIVGVSHHPDLSEKPPAHPREAGGVSRHAHPFEELRDRADALPARPAVFLAAIGPARDHAARVSFATGLFEAGGIAAVVSAPSTDTAELVAEFRASGAKVACLCSTDSLYEQHATEVATALRRAGARRVWLAGKTPQPGVDDHLHAGCDVLDVLRTTLADLEADA